MKRIHLKKRVKKHKIINNIIIIFICVLILAIYLIKIFYDKAMPLFLEYSSIETDKLISLIVSSKVTEEVSNNIDIDKLFIMSKDSDGNIKSIDFNSKLVNEVLVKSSRVAEQNLKYLESGNIDKLNGLNLNKYSNGIIYYIPSGIIFKNNIMTNVFPKIPVRLDLIGNIICKLDTKIEEYGINNVLITINIDVVAEVKILLPFTSKNTKISTKIPLVMKLIQGDIPSYYLNGFLDTPIFSTKVN